MIRTGRVTVGLASLGWGLAAAGVGAALGLAAERAAMGRPLLRLNRSDGTDDSDEQGDQEGFGTLRGRCLTVRTTDGTGLHVEVDDPDETVTDALTVVLCHGYALSLDSWHYQRRALRGRYRLVLWDQRGHGRSGAGAREASTIDQLGDDLSAVIQAVAPDGPLVLVGHSMGGMTVMALADRHPRLYAERVLGVGLVSTSAGGFEEADFGLARIGRMVRRAAPTAVRTLTHAPWLVEHTRRLGSDLESFLVNRYSYASDVAPALVRFTADMIAGTRLEVISDFLPTFGTHDKRAALAALDGVETLVIVGDRDLLTPSEHSEDIIRFLPEAEHVVVHLGGHLLMLEHPDVVTENLVNLIERARRSHGPEHLAGLSRRLRRTVAPLRKQRRDPAV
jgi:pimeloyl-ACP methyl ester carboxylesterase